MPVALRRSSAAEICSVTAPEICFPRWGRRDTVGPTIPSAWRAHDKTYMNHSAHSPIGAVLRGGHRIIDVLQGGMGVVYICHQEATDQLHAVKTVRFDAAEDEVEERVKRFQQEVNNWIQVSRESRCDTIVQALTFDADERHLILEFVDGLPLSRLSLTGRPIHPRHALQWGLDIVEGMEVLHTKFRLLHRDLKPANVLVSRRDMKAKITDLGIVKSLEEETFAATRIGTPAYMPPEQFEGRTDFRSDIFSFGATFLWMVSRQKITGPGGQGVDTTLLPPKVRAFIDRCMAPEPKKRFQTFGEVRAELEALAPEDFTVSDGYYAHCEEHDYYSPLPIEKPEAAACLFCTQKAGLDAKLEAAQVAAESSVAATSSPTAGNTPTVAVTPTPGTVGVGGGTMTMGPESAANRTAPQPRGNPWPRTVAAVLGVVCFGLLAWAFVGGPGDEKDPSEGEVSRNLPEERCKEEGCTKPVHDPVGFIPIKLESWEPEYCAQHLDAICPKIAECGMRYREVTGFTCDNCGDTPKLYSKVDGFKR